MLKWFDTTEVAAFARGVADDYARIRKSSSLRSDDASKLAKKLEKVSASVIEFEKTRKLNVYKKAKLIDGLRNALQAHKVSDADISKFLNTILLDQLPAARSRT